MRRFIGLLFLILFCAVPVYAQDTPATFNYQGKDYQVYLVPTEDGVNHEWALITKGRQSSQFIDPANPDAGLIEWQGNWRSLSVVVNRSTGGSGGCSVPLLPTK